MSSARHGRKISDSAASEDHQLALRASHSGAPKALETLNSILDGCLSRKDAKRAALTSALLMITGQIQGNFRRFPEYIAHLALVRDPGYKWRDYGEELLARAGMLIGLNFFASTDPFLEPCVDRLMALLEQDLDVNARFAAGRAVLFYTEPRDLRALGQRVYSLLRPSVNHPDLTPHRLGHWLVFWSRCARYAKEHQQAELAEQQARQLADEHGLRDVQSWLAFIEVDRSLPEKDIARAERALAVAENIVDHSRLSEMARIDFLRSKLALLKNQGDNAVFHASRAHQYSNELGHPPVMRAIFVVNEAQARVCNNDFAGGRRLLSDASVLVPGQYADEIRDMIALIEAFEAMTAREPSGKALLAGAWGKMRERQYYDTFDGFPEFGARLCVLALEQDIEPEFVRHLIELRGIAPPSNAPETWPWSIRIYALGGFKVFRHGEELAFTGKAQKKPMDLLKVLVAFGGQGVAKQKVYDSLWADADPTAAAAALDVVILRLRKLLGDSDAIRVDEGKVGFDALHVWLDTWAFDRDVEALQGVLLHELSDRSPVDEIGRRLLARYRGPFLGSEDPQRWSLAARDRWQNRFRRSLADAGSHWELQGDFPRAIALYERALEEDSLAEELYRRLMRGYLARGEPAEAARVYRRCREMLSVQLGIPPSPATEALFRSIYGS